MTQDLRKLVEEIEKATINIKDNATKIVNTLEEVIGNDVNQEGEIPLPLRLKLRRQDVTIKQEKSPPICDNY